MDDSDDVLIHVDNGVGILTLNRPGAINSLTQTMIDMLAEVLTEWADDAAVRAVLLRGAGARGLCAGGDVVAIYHSARGDGSVARKFWFEEYRLNSLINRFPKPYVALMDGIVMGGGVGVSAHGDVRVVTDTTKLAMPEVGIGLIPDVGATFLLPRAPGALGRYAALTGAPLTGADAIVLGFADHFVPHDALAAFTAEVIATDISTALTRHAVTPPPSNLVAQHTWIDTCFSAETVSDIIAQLRRHDAGPAGDAADMIAGRSPIALAVTMESLRRAADLDTLDDALIQEYRVSCAALRSHDLVEGIRAQIIDKDRDPKWSPASLAAVHDSNVQAYFLPADPDLTL